MKKSFKEKINPKKAKSGLINKHQPISGLEPKQDKEKKYKTSYSIPNGKRINFIYERTLSEEKECKHGVPVEYKEKCIYCSPPKQDREKKGTRTFKQTIETIKQIRAEEEALANPTPSPDRLVEEMMKKFKDKNGVYHFGNGKELKNAIHSTLLSAKKEWKEKILKDIEHLYKIHEVRNIFDKGKHSGFEQIIRFFKMKL